MDYMEFVKPELVALIPNLYAIGAMLKHTEKIKDNYIPAILTLIGLVLACVYVFSVEGVTGLSIFTAIVQGVICTACAVYGNQLYKQATKGD